LSIASGEALSLLPVIGHHRHRLDAAGDDHVALPMRDALGRQRDRLQARAEAVDGQRARSIAGSPPSIPRRGRC
jgi:hypothetical protein